MARSTGRSYTQDRGIVQATDDTIDERCTLNYLHTLYLELCRTRAFTSTNMSTMLDIQTQHDRIEFLQHEFDRLLRYPMLFPSPAAKHRFFVLCFHRDCEYQFTKSMRDLLINRELRKVDRMSRKYLTRSTYADESYGWENFLLPGAPGVPLNSKETEPRSAFQVLPGVGMRICSDLSREENDVVQFVYGTSMSSTEDHLKSLPLELEAISPCTSQESGKRRSNVRMRHHTQNVILTPSPFREDIGLRFDVRDVTAAPIENFSSMLYRVEQQGPGPNAPAAALNAPNVFPVMGIRSWHRPLRRWDLHYHSNPKSGWLAPWSCTRYDDPSFTPESKPTTRPYRLNSNLHEQTTHSTTTTLTTINHSPQPTTHTFHLPSKEQHPLTPTSKSPTSPQHQEETVCKGQKSRTTTQGISPETLDLKRHLIQVKYIELE